MGKLNICQVIHDCHCIVQQNNKIIDFDLLKVGKFHFSACWHSYRAEYSVLSGAHTYPRIFSIPPRLYFDMFALSLTALVTPYNHRSAVDDREQYNKDIHMEQIFSLY